MNVSGVGAMPPPPPLPPVVPAAPAAAPAPSDGRRQGTPGGQAQPQPERRPAPPPVHDAPPLRMLTVTEMRVMLGQLPASAALRPEPAPAGLSAAS